ncbi:Fe2OG dioxygenase domain-containing protein [Citrus sinensis]|nr:Fe2OG dioxygenase domain-containing protein [Citrus sinensis]
MADQNGLETKVSAALNCIDLSDPDIQKSAASLKQMRKSKNFLDGTFGHFQFFYFVILTVKAHGEAYSLVGPETEDDLDPEKPLCGPNVWPSADVLPGWKETMLRYQQEALNLGRKIGRIIALALDLDVDFFDKPEILGNAMPYVSFNHYGVQDADPSKEYILGTPAHSDPSLITLLATDEVPGLQICRNIHANPRVWENVAPLKDAFIVNIGDMLERMSNCVFRSTMHRVLFRQERYTIAYFVYPSNDAMIECFPTCKSEEKPPKYHPIKCKDLFNIIFKNVADGKTARDITEA